MSQRLFLVFFIFCLFSLSLIVRTIYLQFGYDKRIVNLKNKQFKTKIHINSQRGKIWDRHGKELAVSISSYSLYAHPSKIKKKYETSRKLSKILKISFKKIRKKLNKKNFVWIQRKLSKEIRDKIQFLNIEGLNFIEEPKRIYPHERLLSQTLGFVGIDNKGLEGIEFKYNKELEAKKKTISLLRDARGRPLVSQGYFLTQHPQGNSLKLTIDQELQFFLEKELTNSIIKNQAKSALGVILEAHTSEILALANIPGYDANKPLKSPKNSRKNHIVNSTFEPGSTMKSFIIAGALEEKLIKPNTKIDCEDGSFQIDDRVITEAGGKKYSTLTVSDVLKHSSNICVAKISFLLGDKKVFKILKKFGFGQKTNVDLPGEQKGILKKPPLRKHHLSNISFGQGISVTALQVANAYTAIANGGFLNRPFIVKELINGSDGVKRKISNKVTKKRVLSQEVSEMMQLILTYAAPKASHINGFPVAGKTGTAQKVDFVKSGYKKNAFLSSFAGILPAHDPKFVIYIAIDEPQKKHYGSQVAAPVFAQLARYIARKAQLTPIFIDNPQILKKQNVSLDYKQEKALKKLKVLSSLYFQKMPDLIGFSLKESYHILKKRKIKVKIKGSGFVKRTYPHRGAILKKNQLVELILE